MPAFLQKVRMFFNHPDIRFYLAKLGLDKRMSDEQYLRRAFRVYMGRELDLDKPQTYNEKLQWLKLYDRRELYTTLVDKYAVKQWVSERIGPEHVIPTLGAWDHFDQIDFDALPDRFVLKCTHDSGGLVIVRDKKAMDRQAVRQRMEAVLRRDYYLPFREWPYKDVPRRIIAEEYIEDPTSSHGLHDYKIFTFDGKAKLFFVTSDRGAAIPQTNDYFDMDGNKLPINWIHPPSDRPFERPAGFEKMVEMAECLAEGIPHVRVDFYDISGRILFGEMTMYTAAGFTPIQPAEYDLILGQYLNLPEKRTKE